MTLEINRKRLFLFGSFIVVLIAIPITVYLSGQKQEQRSQASGVPDSTVVVVVNGNEITKGDVKEVALEQYEGDSLTDEILKDTLKTVEEREILDEAKNEMDIEIDQALVDELIGDGYSEKEAYYQVLKNQVILKVVRTRSAYTIQFWNPPQASFNRLSQDDKALATRQLTDGTVALSIAKTALERGDEPLQIGADILTRYPSLKPVLAVNGYLIDGLTQSDKIMAKEPQIYELGDSGLDSETEPILVGMQKDEVKAVSGTSSNRGGIVFKVLSANDAGDDTYDDWYKIQENASVRELDVL